MIVDLSRWRSVVLRDRLQHRTAGPFPHTVVDDLLDPDAYAAAVAAFPAGARRTWTNYSHVNERKLGNMRSESWPAELRSVADALCSPEFVAGLETLTGIEGLLPDPDMDGGGLHRSEPGGYLNVHTDFTAHHRRPTWRRRVNLLLYLNAEWRPEWGGDLELWDAAMTEPQRSIAPIGNRAVIFETTEVAFHGHPKPLRCPAGVARQSLALYYFTEGTPGPSRPTTYRARPSDGWRSALIGLDNQAVRAYDALKRRTGLSDDAASRVLGAAATFRRRVGLTGRRHR